MISEASGQSAYLYRALVLLSSIKIDSFSRQNSYAMVSGCKKDDSVEWWYIYKWT